VSLLELFVCFAAVVVVTFVIAVVTLQKIGSGSATILLSRTCEEVKQLCDTATKTGYGIDCEPTNGTEKRRKLASKAVHAGLISSQATKAAAVALESKQNRSLLLLLTYSSPQ
jgi:hypothetical protein